MLRVGSVRARRMRSPHQHRRKTKPWPPISPGADQPTRRCLSVHAMWMAANPIMHKQGSKQKYETAQTEGKVASPDRTMQKPWRDGRAMGRNLISAFVSNHFYIVSAIISYYVRSMAAPCSLQSVGPLPARSYTGRDTTARGPRASGPKDIGSSLQNVLARTSIPHRETGPRHTSSSLRAM